ncbi:hypothetical protein [Luteimonas kalidii]|uniref:Sugar transporter n=1 Tax=Luteimonas kalidii TaxID=3042025 RepID=A0ABT6JQF4_9GAMM|nr:hypothetical protein [Luteimonas kalidii]MDH5832912.1 hypothetical protein [Luteimonas kalidii]
MGRGQGGDRSAAQMPWQAWLAGGMFLLYGIAAAFDHGMSLAVGEAYYRSAGMTDGQVAYFSAVPAWAIVGWTLSVWGGLAAAAALLLKRRQAWILFVVSLVGGLLYVLHVLVLTPGREAMGVLWAMPLVLAGLTLAMAVYSRRLARRGVLR